MAGSTGLSATAYVVLGLVSIRPMAGYDLVAYAERSIGNFFPLTRSHIYAELEHLGQLGLLEATETVQRDAPTRRVYQITLAGSNELQRWLDDTALTEERSRNLFLVRIFFGDRTSRERLAALLDEYEAAARTRIDLLAALVDRLAGRSQYSAGLRRCSAFAASRRRWNWVTDVRPVLLAATAPEEETLTACGGG